MLYNAFSDKYLVTEGNIAGPYTDDTDIEKKMRSIGALVNDDLDEVNIYRNILHNQDFYDGCFHLIINPTLDCNFRCWYCYESHLHGSVMDSNVYDSIKQLIENRLLSDSVKIFSLSFFGGEPMLRYNDIVGPLIEYSSELCQKREIEFNIHFTTNGYLINDHIIEQLKGKKCALQITLDGYRASHDKTRFSALGRGSYDKIISNIIKLAENQLRVAVRINYTKDNIADSTKIIEDLLKVSENNRKHISIDLQHVWQDKANNDTDTVFTIVTDVAEQFIKNGFIAETHSAKKGGRHTCYGDNPNYLLVNYNGDVFRCTARDFVTAKRHGVLTAGGMVEWDKEILQNFKTCKENQTECLKCRVAPLCGGACRQLIMEVNDPNKCIFGLSESDKDQMVINHFEDIFLKKFNL